MEYIWNDYSVNRRYLLKNKADSSGGEVSFYENDNTVYFDPSKRFSDISPALFALSEQSSGLTEPVIRYLATMDKLAGIVMYDFHFNAINSEIISGRYGEEIRDLFDVISISDKAFLIGKLEQYHKSGERKDFFQQVFYEVFGDKKHMSLNAAEMYYNRSGERYYCYCATKETVNTSALFKLITLLFADIEKEYIPVWGNNCFGIIDGLSCSMPLIGRTLIL